MNKLPHPLLGKTVPVTGMNGYSAGTGTIVSVSPTGKRIDLTHKGCRRAFYRQDETRWVFEPGCGIGGSFLNDSFKLSAEDAATVARKRVHVRISL